MPPETDQDPSFDQSDSTLNGYAGILAWIASAGGIIAAAITVSRHIRRWVTERERDQLERIKMRREIEFRIDDGLRELRAVVLKELDNKHQEMQIENVTIRREIVDKIEAVYVSIATLRAELSELRGEMHGWRRPR